MTIHNHEGGNAANYSIEVTANQVTAHAEYVDSLSPVEHQAYSAAFNQARLVIDNHFLRGEVARLREQNNAQSDLLVEQEQLVEDVMYSASHDALTGLLNRGAFEQDIKARMQSGTPLMLMLLDLDKFKSINDTFGHPRGDQALQEFSQRLREKFKRQSDLLTLTGLFRLGGDEFAVAINLGDQEENGVENHADQERRRSSSLRERVLSEAEYMKDTVDEFVEEQPQDIKDLKFNVSVGFAYWNPVTDPDALPLDLYHEADEALYQVKKQTGRGR